MICIALAQAQLGPALAQVDGTLYLQRRATGSGAGAEADHFYQKQRAGRKQRGARTDPQARLQQRNHFLELRFAVVQDFGARIEKRVGDVLQFGLAGLAALFKCHVQSVLSNL